MTPAPQLHLPRTVSGNRIQRSRCIRMETIMKPVWTLVMRGLRAAQAQSGTSALFLGNSFTFGFGSPVRF